MGIKSVLTSWLSTGRSAEPLGASQPSTAAGRRGSSTRRATVRLFCHALMLIASTGTWASSQSPKTAPAAKFEFLNLNAEVFIRHNGSGYVLTQADRSISVNVANRLLVSTRQEVSANELKALGLHISRVQQLARLKRTTLWLATLTDIGDLQRTMDRLRQDKRIVYAQPDLLQTRLTAQHQKADAPESPAPNRPANGKGRVRLAIIDDGFDFSHPEFAGLNLAFEYDADQKTRNAAPKGEQDQHGTLVAGVIVAAADNKGVDGLAPDVELVAIRQVSTWTSDMVLAFSVARMLRADIVNSSWTLPFLPEPLFDLLSDWSQEENPYLVFAAGNDRQDACKENALSQLEGAWLIGAAGSAGKRLPYSNHGSCVAFHAPARLMSTAAFSHGYRNFGGTSAAAAYASGLIARELAHGRKPDKHAMQQLLKIQASAHTTHHD